MIAKNSLVRLFSLLFILAALSTVDASHQTLRSLGKGGKGYYPGKRSCKHHRGKGKGKGRYYKDDVEQYKPASLYFDIRLAEGESEAILEDGPLYLFATCDETGIRLDLNVEWHKDLLVFGDISEDNHFDDPPLVNQVLTAGTFLEKYVWAKWANRQGNDVNDGAFWLSSGHYVGWSGDSTIGIHRSNATDLALAGDNVNCVVAGVIEYVFKDC